MKKKLITVLLSALRFISAKLMHPHTPLRLGIISSDFCSSGTVS